MKVEDNKIVTFEQEIRSEGKLLAHWLRTLLFKPGCVGEQTYQTMLGLDIGQNVTFKDDSLVGVTHNPNLIQEIPISQLNTQSIEPFVGLCINTDINGAVCQAVIREVKSDTLLIDANHTWLGKLLINSITIKDIREPTKSETECDGFFSTREFIS